MHSPDIAPLHTRRWHWRWSRGSRLWHARPGGHRNDSPKVCRSARTVCPHQLQHRDGGEGRYCITYCCICVWQWGLWSFSLHLPVRWEDPAERWTSFYVAPPTVRLDRWAISPAAHVCECSHCCTTPGATYPEERCEHKTEEGLIYEKNPTGKHSMYR